MPLCKRCGKGFPVCKGCEKCDPKKDWVIDYCSLRCWELSSEYRMEQKTLEAAAELLDSLSYEQCLILYLWTCNNNMLDIFLEITLSELSKKSS